MGTDVFTKEKRSEVMSAIRSKNTKPEIKVRKTLHKLGYRFRLHRKDLPGKPDVVLPKHRMAVLVHGCFWHQHGCRKSSVPKQNAEYWMTKLQRNVERDEQAVEELQKKVWEVTVIWECKLEKGIEELVERLGDAGRGKVH
ncbi:MAG: DNA mismatch endonuclease Vsr [Tumebacillaceae bacterium]